MILYPSSVYGKVAHRAQLVPLPLSEAAESEITSLAKSPEELILEEPEGEEGSGESATPVEVLTEGSGREENHAVLASLSPLSIESDTLSSKEPEKEQTQNQIKATTANRNQTQEDCHSKVDIVFLLDTSGSIEQIYQEHVRWAVALVESLPIEQDTVRVAAVQYAGFPLTEFALGTYPNAEDIRQHLAQINFQSGVTRTGYALRKAEAELFRSDRGAREGAKKVIVLFTDGLSIDDPTKPAEQLRDLKGVTIYVVSVGADGFEPEMNRIAGKRENVFGPEGLPRLRNALIAEAERARACLRVGSDRSNRFQSQSISSGTSFWSIDPVEHPQVVAPPQAQNISSGDRPQLEELLDKIESDLAADILISNTNQTEIEPNVTKTSGLNEESPPTVSDISNNTTNNRDSSLYAPSSANIKHSNDTASGSNVDAENDVFETSDRQAVANRRLVPAPPTTRQSFSTTRITTPAPSRTSAPTTTRRKTIETNTTTAQSATRARTRAHITSEAPHAIVTATQRTLRPADRARTTPARIPLAISNNRASTATISSAVQSTPSLTPRSEFLRARTLPPTPSTSSTTKPRLFASLNRKITEGEICPLDWLFIVDSSGSVQSVYDRQKEYLGDVLRQIKLGTQAHRVALLQFAGSEIQKTEWSYDTYESSDSVMNAFSQVRHITGTTYIGAALESALKILDARRRQIPSIVVLLSDGFSQDDATAPAEKIRNLPSSEFFALSIAQLSNSQYLATLTGDAEHVFVGDRADALKTILVDRLHCRRRLFLRK
ncbi:von willebrand factor type A domain-containing protein [Ditylenchus destructor]|uniref:von willebrand factor type A domain-containing protein n=1 Tax=Ditylenchus destructor TaxID=166010 RepID=A0AAD4NEM4_9BILA|nr:von willebrand factor type A domain-containing protein [Ditylenchus destructor]